MKLKKVSPYWVLTIVSEDGVETLCLTDNEVSRIRKRSRTTFEPKPVTLWKRIKFAWRILCGQ